MIGLKVLVREKEIIEQMISEEFSEGVRKHLWQMAYPEKIYFVGELMGMSQFSPKMVFRTWLSIRLMICLGSFSLFFRG